MSLLQGILHVMVMVLTSKELLLKLAVPKKQAKSLKTTLCVIVNEKYCINFLKKFMSV